MKNNTTKVGTAHQVGSYRKEGTGSLVFRYTVKGTDEQLAAYKEAQGEDYYRETDDGEPLWFSTRNVGKRAELMISSKGKIFADMSELDAAASLAAQYGGNFGQELARQAVVNLFGNTKQQVQENSVQANSADLNQS